MNFLYPLFLAGMAAVTVPIILHLIKRHTRKHVTFSSLMFLQASPPRLRQRSRVEQWPLLLLRCLILCLLAFIFARPFFSQPGERVSDAVSRRLVLLVDTSASMQRDTLWQQVLDQARETLDTVRESDRVAVIAFDRQPQILIGFETWSQTPVEQRHALSMEAVEVLFPTWSHTALGQALVLAAETLEEDRLNDQKALAGQQRVVLISDLQQGSDLESLRVYDWPEAVSLTVQAVTSEQVTNATVQQMAQTDPQTVTLRLTNAGESDTDRFQLTSSLDPNVTDVYVPAGHSAVLTLPRSRQAVSGQFQLIGDQQIFDNTLYMAQPWDQNRTLLYLGQDDANDPDGLLWYLHKALASDTTRALQIVSKRTSDPLTEAEMMQAQAVVIGDVLTSERTDWLLKILEAGRLVLVVMKSPEQIDLLRALSGHTELQVNQVTPDEYGMLSRLDFEHPVLAPFAQAQFMDFTRIHIWQYCRVSIDSLSDARVLAWLEEAVPAWFSLPVSRGTLMVSTFSWQPEQSDLALSSKFVPWLYALLDHGGVLTEQRPQYHVGDAVPLPGHTQALTVVKPTGDTVAMSSSENLFTQTNDPGLYTIQGDTESRVFAVNLHPTESRTDLMPLEELESLGVNLATERGDNDPIEVERQRHASALALEREQKLWRVVLCLLLVVCFMEMGLAGWLTRSGPESSGERP